MKKELRVGVRIYYTGDMANSEGNGTIQREREATPYSDKSVDIKLDDGRLFRGISPLGFESGAGRRFWILKEWEAEQKANLQKFYAINASSK